MEFFWSDECSSFKKRISDFARDELAAPVAERDRTQEFSREDWDRCARFGIQGLPIPTQYDGQGFDILKATAGMEALGYGCRDNGLLLALSAQMWTVQMPVLQHGTEEQKARYLPGLCRGELIGALALTEADAGSDAYSLQMTAKKVDGGYILNGEKLMVTLAPLADVALVFATADPSLGKWGLSIFLVESGAPGYEAQAAREKMGLRTVPLGALTLRDCFVPESQRLGPEGAGAAIFGGAVEWERSCMLASQLGAMERQLEEAVRFAAERHQFGQPIGKFQSVSHRLADMKVRLEAARLFVYKAAWLKHRLRHAPMEAAMAKLIVCESFVESSIDAIRTRGGSGYMTDQEVERDLRDAVGGVLYGGTSDIQRNTIARIMGL